MVFKGRRCFFSVPRPDLISPRSEPSCTLSHSSPARPTRGAAISHMPHMVARSIKKSDPILVATKEGMRVPLGMAQESQKRPRGSQEQKKGLLCNRKKDAVLSAHTE